ncbi:MAG: hypothetical protein HY738_09565 [Bacteroidia bacterium]|nr:hypothetical protein [Bacteroidia bacterium]
MFDNSEFNKYYQISDTVIFKNEYGERLSFYFNFPIESSKPYDSEYLEGSSPSTGRCECTKWGKISAKNQEDSLYIKIYQSVPINYIEYGIFDFMFKESGIYGPDKSELFKGDTNIYYNGHLYNVWICQIDTIQFPTQRIWKVLIYNKIFKFWDRQRQEIWNLEYCSRL